MSINLKYIPVFIANEIPSGDIDGFNKIFNLFNNPINNEVIIRLNGLIQTPGNEKDYILSGSQIIFNKAPKIGMEVTANYFK